MAHKDRKIRKYRGTRNCGWGNTQKHRGAGSRGGRGNAGIYKHKWCRTSKFFPDHLGKHGFKRHSADKKISAINIGFIEENLDNLVNQGKIKADNGKFYLNLMDLNCDKLLGAGKVNHKFVITLNRCSEKAKKKIEEAGGKVIIANENDSNIEVEEKENIGIEEKDKI